MLWLGTCHLGRVPFVIFRGDRHFLFENCGRSYRRGSKDLIGNRSLLALLCLAYGEMQVLGRFDLRDDCMIYGVLKCLCFASLEIEMVEDGVVEVTHS
jgi:hypothetical protein